MSCAIPAAYCGRDAAGARTVLCSGSRVRSRAVVLAMGVSYRLIQNPELDRFRGAGVFYGAAISQASVITGRDVAVVGGGNSAGQAASFLAAHARRVTVLVRGGSLADSMLGLPDLHPATRHSNIDIRYHTEVVGALGERRLQRLQSPRHLDRGAGSPARRRGVHHDRRRSH